MSKKKAAFLIHPSSLIPHPLVWPPARTQSLVSIASQLMTRCWCYPKERHYNLSRVFPPPASAGSGMTACTVKHLLKDLERISFTGKEKLKRGRSQRSRRRKGDSSSRSLRFFPLRPPAFNSPGRFWRNFRDRLSLAACPNFTSGTAPGSPSPAYPAWT